MIEYHSREWLNKEKGTAAIEASVEFQSDEEEEWSYVHGSFTISDCSRKVELDFAGG